MRNYLDRLVRGLQESEFAVQPRPVSRFESPSHLILEPFESSSRGMAHEPGLASAYDISKQTSLAQPRQQVGRLDEYKIVRPTAETRPIKEAHKPYPRGQLAKEPSNVSHASRTEIVPQSVQEGANPGLHRRFPKPIGPIARGEEKPIKPAHRIEEPVQAVGMPDSKPARGGESSKLMTYVVEEKPTQIYLPVEIDEQTMPLGIHISDPLGIKKGVGLKEPVSPEGQEEVRSVAKLRKPEEKKASSFSTRIVSHREMGRDGTPPVSEPFFHRKTELMPMLDVAHRPEREQRSPFTEHTTPRFARESVADSPTIQVTIGRVEIRATVGSTPTRKAPVKSSAMSLDEYLLRRSGGRP
ncbi:MAG: hypothetical protein R3B95_14735 [Nitrospirales bacterium]|nr:hypothetical protein [Nitrospirales bacterium]